MLPRLCCQHATALCMGAAWDVVDILKPCFCLAKAMTLGNVRTSYLNAAFQILSVDLQVICESERPDFRPYPADLAANRRLLEACCFPKRSHECDQAHSSRKQLGMHFLEFFVGCFFGNVIVHWCRGCCADRGEAIMKGWDLLQRVVFGHVQKCKKQNDRIGKIYRLEKWLDRFQLRNISKSKD